MTSHPHWQRVFIALWPDASSRQALAAHQPTAGHGVRPLHEADLHLTVAFLGGLDAPTAAQLTARLQGVAPAALDLTTQHATLWPDADQPRVQVLQYAATPALLALHDAVGNALRALKLPIETRPYRPHVTLARVTPAASALPRTPVLTSRFTRFALCHGITPEPGEPRYRTIADWSGPT